MGRHLCWRWRVRHEGRRLEPGQIIVEVGNQIVIDTCLGQPSNVSFGSRFLPLARFPPVSANGMERTLRPHPLNDRL